MRLIDADDLTADISSIRVYVGGKDITDPEYRESVLMAIAEAPTVDAGVKCGEWIKKPCFPERAVYICSECASIAINAYLFGRLYKYCPYCGALMQSGGTKCENN